MTAILIALAIAVAGAFGLGSVLNIRRGTAILRWMQGGLPLLGERTTVRWLGTTAVELVIKDARAPFRQVTVIVFLEPRDMPWMRALTRRRGRRDTLIVRGQLRTPPRADIEVLDRESWSGREALGRVERESWSVREPAARGELAIYCEPTEARPRVDTLVGLARDAGLAVRRLSIRRSEPHLQLHVAPPPSVTAPANAFFETVRALGENAQGAAVRSTSLRP